MPDYSEERTDYARYRLQRSKEDLEAAELLFDNGQYRIANNTAYYSMFHGLRAVLAFDVIDFSKHSGVIAEFRRRYIKEGVFPAEMSKMIGEAFTIRNASDYDDMFIVSRTGTMEQIESAKYVYQHVKDYVESIIQIK